MGFIEKWGFIEKRLSTLGPRSSKAMLSLEQAADLLRVSPEALKRFETSYQDYIKENEETDLFHENSRMATARNFGTTEGINRDLQKRIVDELVEETEVYSFDAETQEARVIQFPVDKTHKPVTPDEIATLPPEIQPQLTGKYMRRDIPTEAYRFLLLYYQQFLTSRNPKMKQMAYNRFRQGLDILDLDPITYEILGQNRNSIEHWFPALVEACRGQKNLRLPSTKFAKVPLTMLQLTRIQYETLTRATKDIVDAWAMRVFGLDVDREYFIKTGTYSSKFDFRNAHVHGAQEVRELGEYLLYIHYQALCYAGGLNDKGLSLYGMSTTREWVVREFIPPAENYPCIYKGLPLRTEYRVFVDCDQDRVLGIANYWDPDVMEQRFQSGALEENSPHDAHDYVIYKSQKEPMIARFQENQETVKAYVNSILPKLDLEGQWSIDVMQNGDDFWIIDMAVAEQSFFYKDVVAPQDRHPLPENWLPSLN